MTHVLYNCYLQHGCKALRRLPRKQQGGGARTLFNNMDAKL